MLRREVPIPETPPELLVKYPANVNIVPHSICLVPLAAAVFAANPYFGTSYPDASVILTLVVVGFSGWLRC